jgi:hypothetical protein
MIVIPSAQAAIGNANASIARTTTRLMLIPPNFFSPNLPQIFRPRCRSPALLSAFVVPKL